MGFFRNKKKDENKQDEIIDEQPKVQPASVQLSDDSAAYGILIGPHMTEKSALLRENNQYVFKVHSGVNKIQIKSAVEKLFSVKVMEVKIVNLPEKKRRLGKTIGTRSGFKKAIVRLKEGDKIDSA